MANPVENNASALSKISLEWKQKGYYANAGRLL